MHQTMLRPTITFRVQMLAIFFFLVAKTIGRQIFEPLDTPIKIGELQSVNKSIQEVYKY